MRVLALGLMVVLAGLLSACDDGVANTVADAPPMPASMPAEDVVIEMDVPEGEAGIELPDLAPQACEFDALVGTVYAEGALGDVGDRPVRVLYPDSMATMDYSPDRINVHVEPETNVITAIRCG